MTVAQLMMTDVTREAFPSLMQQRVLGTLGMAHSTYEQPPPASFTAIAATGYLGDGKPVAGAFHTYPEEAAAGLWTTPTDLARWIVGVEHAYDGTSDRLMSQASAKAMLTEGLGHWGLGVEVGGKGDDFHFTHGGDDWGFKAIFMAWPVGERAVIVMANGDDGAPLIGEIMQAVAQEYGWKGDEPRVYLPRALNQQERAELIGSYGHGRAVISSVGEKVRMTDQASSYDVIAVVDGPLRIIDPSGFSAPLWRSRGADGRIEGVNTKGLTLARDP